MEMPQVPYVGNNRTNLLKQMFCASHLTRLNKQISTYDGDVAAPLCEQLKV